MKLSTNIVFQVLSTIVQYGNVASGIVPAKAVPWIALVVGLAQAAVAWRAHYFNTDGTPQSVAKV